MDKNYEQFWEKVTNLLGAERVYTSDKMLDSFRASDPEVDGNPLALLKPESGSQIPDLMKLAREEKVNLVYCSSSTPRFRGDTVPKGDGVIVDMSSLENIVRVDRRNKVALIEPGVTFPELISEVDKVGLKVLMPLLPRTGKSVLASYLEREPILIPKYHWDMTDPLLCTELVFGTGDKFRTGSAAGPGSLEQQWAVGGAQKNPLGPAQTDMARLVQGSQGTLAAVTWATVKLELKPTIHKFYFIPATDLSKLIEFAYKALRPKLGDEFFILNSYELSTLVGNEGSEIDKIADKQYPYTLVFAVAGYQHLPEKRVAYQEKDMARIAKEADVNITREVPGCSANRMASLVGGCSSPEYYKTKPRGAFREIFFLTTLDQANKYINIMHENLDKYDYPRERMGIYIQPIQHGRTVHVEFSLYYDPNIDSESKDLDNLYAEASESLASAGAFFSRPYGVWSDLAYRYCPDTVKALNKVKDILDPDHILNRGTLCFEEVK